MTKSILMWLLGKAKKDYDNTFHDERRKLLSQVIDDFEKELKSIQFEEERIETENQLEYLNIKV